MFAERLAQLPPVLQNAIQNTELEKKLRGLADTHQLHLDQWQSLENEVKLALYGFEDVENLSKNIEQEVGVDMATAVALAQDISRVIFEPIREEMERELGHPQAKLEAVSDMEQMRRQTLALGENKAEIPPAAAVPTPAVTVVPAVQPATPPAPPPAEKAVREPVSGSYHAAQPSTARTTIAGDPYRESVS